MNKRFRLYSGVAVIILILSASPIISMIDVDAHHSIDDEIGYYVDYTESMSGSNSVHYNYWYSDRDAYASSSIGYCIGHSMHAGHWTYEIWFNGYMNSEGTYGFYKNEMLMASAFDVSVTQNAPKCDIYVTNPEKYAWSTGGSSRDHDQDGLIADMMISGLLTAVSLIGGTPKWTIATAVVDLLLNGGFHEKTSKTNSLWYLWQWDNGTNDAYSTMYFKADVNYGETTQITCKYHVFGMGFELLTVGPFVLDITAPSTSTQSDPYLMTDEERQSCGIITVNSSNVDEYSSVLHLSETDLSNIRSSEEDYYYTVSAIDASILTQDIIENNAVQSSIDMIHYLEEEYAKSQMIIDVFSNLNSVDHDYLQDLIAKHNEIQEWICNSIDRIKNGVIPSAIMDEYQIIK